MAEFKITIKNDKRLSRRLNESPKIVFRELSNAVKTSVNIIRPLMRQEAPHKTGELRKHIYARATGLRGEVGPNLDITPYAWWVHEGTSPYVIRPTTKKALYWQGAKYPVKKVNHPGIRANPFVERTYNRIKPQTNVIFNKAIEKIIREI